MQHHFFQPSPHKKTQIQKSLMRTYRIYLVAKTGFHDLEIKYEYFHMLVLL